MEQTLRSLSRHALKVARDREQQKDKEEALEIPDERKVRSGAVVSDKSADQSEWKLPAI